MKHPTVAANDCSYAVPGMSLPPLPPFATVAANKRVDPPPIPRPMRSPCEPPPVEGDPSDIDPALEADLDPHSEFCEKKIAATNRFKDRDLPLWLLAGGLLLIMVQVAHLSNMNGAAMAGAMMFVSVKTIINVALMLIGVLVAARVAHIDFGMLGPAILKLCALYVGPATLGAIISEMLGGDMAVAMLGGGVSTILYWSLLSYLFRLDAMQTMICVVTIWVVGFVAGVCAVGAILATFASVLG